jgi:hypothetical protein
MCIRAHVTECSLQHSSNSKTHEQSRCLSILKCTLALLFFFFLWDWGLNSGLCAYKVDTHHLSPASSPFCSGYFGDGGLANYLPGLSSNLSLSDFSLPNSYHYRYEPLIPAKMYYNHIGKRLTNKKQLQYQ